MKKTLAILLAAVSCSMSNAAEILSIPVGTEEIANTYDFSAITTHVFTLGITLDTNLLAKLAEEQSKEGATSTKEVLFSLSGATTEVNNYGAEGILFSKGDTSFTTAKHNKEITAISSLTAFNAWSVNSQEKRMLFYMGFIGFEKRKSRYPSPMTNEKTPFLKEFYFDLFHFVLFKYAT